MEVGYSAILDQRTNQGPMKIGHLKADVVLVEEFQPEDGQFPSEKGTQRYVSKG